MADPTPTAARSIDAENDPPVESARGGMPRIGDVVAGRYRIERILGSGGMGVVVEARHTTLGELVAIKFLRADARKDPALGERFLREAKSASRLKGEHVARVHDVGTTEAGHAYLVMEHLSGSDLSTLISERGALPVSEAVDYVLQACEGLAEAHACGIVHRDLKPSNLFLTNTSDRSTLIKLLDFGIAKANTEAEGAVALTDTHAVFGSPAYMSPEQIRSAKNVDARSDIWSLGVVLFELLSATIPFRGESSTAVLAAVAADQPMTLKEVRPDVPADLSALVARCLAKDPARRVQSVLELAIALLPFAAGRSTISVERIRRMSLPPPPPPDPSGKPRGPLGALTSRAWATTAAAPSTLAPPLKKPPLALVPLAIIAVCGLAYLGLRTKPKAPDVAITTPSALPAQTALATPPPSATSALPEPAVSTAAQSAADAGRTTDTGTASAPAKPTDPRHAQGPRGPHPRVGPPGGAVTVPPTTASAPTAPPVAPAPVDPMKSNAAQDWR